MMAAIKDKPKLLDADPAIAMLAHSYRLAFKQADGDTRHAQQARVEICLFFSRQNLDRLYHQGLITWKPDEVIV